VSNDEESLTALAQRYRRNTRDLGIIRLCDDVLARHQAPPVSIAIAPTKVKVKTDRQAYQREYMRDYMRRKRAAT
jgi:hypothetical protein